MESRACHGAGFSRNGGVFRPERRLTGHALRDATIVFDLDGTLVDTAPDLISSLNVVLGECGLPPLPIEAARLVAGRGARAMVARGFEAEGLTVPAEREPILFERFIEVY